MATRICRRHGRRECSTCRSSSSGSNYDTALWTTVHSSGGYDSGSSSSSYDTGSSSSSGGGDCGGGF